MTEDAFRGHVGRTVTESTPWWEPPVRPAAGAPNIVVIVLDDVGFGQLGCFGSSIDTPAMDALAAGGLRYTNFHATALCSTTRSCLLTGRNHHAAGVGFLADFDTGYPSYRGTVTPRATTVAEMLGGHGYGTYLSGKWHVVPPSAMTPAGPFHQWPTGRGFDRYYGFLWGDDDQWAPELWSDQHHVEPPDRPDYHLSADLVDQAERFIADHVSAAPDRPFMLQLAFAACHAPHQAPREFIDRYGGAFDHGWDVERERVLARQIELGVVPPGTRMPGANPGVAAWAELTVDQRRVYARLQEAFAGFMEHTDVQIARLVDFLRRHRLFDDTMIVLLSDNGASGEGGADGSINEYRYFLDLPDDLADSLAALDDIGGPHTHNHYPSGWAQAGNTPLKFYKKHTYGGGVRTPLIVHWPGHISDPGTVRTQFHHVIDVVPTLLEVAGAEAPDTYRGVPQLPMHGTSMAYTFSDAEAASARRLQYFETAGHRGLYRDGWKIVTNHEPGTDFDADRFELYRLSDDFSESDDLAGHHPDVVAGMVDAWWKEARKYDVLPLDDRMQERVASRDPATERNHYRLLPGARLSNGSAGPNFAGRPFRVVARLGPRGAGDGVLLAYGRRAAGFSLFVRDGRLVYDLNLAGRHTVVRTPEQLPSDATTLGMSLITTGDDARVELLVDGTTAGKAAIPRALPAGLGCLSTQCGHNSPSPVSTHYDPPFTFGGDLLDVVIEFGDPDETDGIAVWRSALGAD
ncbi:arylsulfatase [Haloactinopolyspora alba]|uniref:Arylsulfatase n=1 Tax=Haloactinopolyspora alba TaxID=648780 RepID=A0A2P8E043_9ACTN|nr:arylsulfatase [Haloactinopolyspora alba]PSL02843.1 arylsulfatase [Haloactinopolyspora alba]